VRPEGANFDCPAFCPYFLSYAFEMCNGVATVDTSRTCGTCMTPYFGQTRSCDSRKSEEEVRGYPRQTPVPGSKVFDGRRV
jgi:hypothetical protein